MFQDETHQDPVQQPPMGDDVGHEPMPEGQGADEGKTEETPAA